MSLNDRERAALEQLETQLRADDPHLNDLLDGRRPERHLKPSLRYGAGAAAGLAALPAAAYTGIWPIAGAGYIVAVACGAQLLRVYGPRAARRIRQQLADDTPTPDRET